jgi:DNA-binding MarR family transcriptional regulator
MLFSASQRHIRSKKACLTTTTPPCKRRFCEQMTQVASTGLPLRDLGVRAQLDATSTTWLVDQLEQAGLVERKRNNPDRRIVRVWLTEAGQQSQAELAPQLSRWEDVLRQELLPYHTTEEIATFRSVLATLINTLPEGDDLWEQLSTSWDSKLDLLRSLTETTDEKG